MNASGNVYIRSAHVGKPLVVSFQCALIPSRIYGYNHFSLYNGPTMLCGDRRNVWGHSYGPPWAGTVPVFFKQDGSWLEPPNLGGTPQWQPLGQMTKDANRGCWIGDATKLWANPLVMETRRTVTPLFNQQSVTVLDELACDPSLVPHVIWNTPLQPKLIPTGFLLPGCQIDVDTWDSMKLVGGPGHETDGLDGVPFVSSSQHEDTGWQKLGIAEQVHQGGHWRIHVIPKLVSGSYRLVTTWKVTG